MEFPRDIELKIIKNLDIDTRRALGIKPCRLKVPETFLENLISPFHNGFIVLGDEPKYLLTYKREIIARGVSFYSNDFVTYKPIGE